MTDTAAIVLASLGLAGTWTVSVALFSWWLSAQFRRLEGLIFRLMEEHKGEVDRRARNLENRILVMELRLFGFGPVIQDHDPLPPSRQD